MDDLNEEWRPVPGYEERYAISSLGRVKSLKRVVFGIKGYRRSISERILRAKTHKKGYLEVSLCKEGRKSHFRVHILVMRAFVGPCPEGKQTRHLNGNHADNRTDNLRYGTPVENAGDMISHGRQPRGENNGQAVLMATQVNAIRSLSADVSHAEIARRFGVNPQTIMNVRLRRTWKHLS